jgi:hypothetical protein
MVSETTYVLFCLNFSRAYNFLVIFLSPDNGADKRLASASRLTYALQKYRQHNTATASSSLYLRIISHLRSNFPPLYEYRKYVLHNTATFY